MEQTKQENFYLSSTPVKKLLVKFSIPCILSMLVSALYNIIDQLFIGMKLGTAGIYATTVVYPFTVIALAIALLIGDGCAALFSISLGAKDNKTGNKAVANAITSSIISGIVFALLGLIFKGPILNICGATPESLAFATEYYNIILIGLPFYIITSTLASIIRADGSPKYSMIATIVGAIINLILDPIFILGCDMGMLGAALATIIGQVASAVLCLLYFRKPKLIKLTKESFKPSFKIVGKFSKLGISSLITQLSIALITIVANVVLREIVPGDSSGVGGVLGVAFKIFGIVIAFSVGVSVGGQPIIGYNYGAKNYKRVFETYKYILIVNVIVGVVATILFMACPIIFAKMFNISPDLYSFTEKCFRIYLGAILLCCVQKASCIFLQSINKPYKAMILSLMRDVIFLIPGVCLLGLLAGLDALLWAGIITDVLSFIFTVIFVLVEYKKLIKSKEKNKEQTTEIPLSKQTYAITIGREFGSGGKYIAQRLAEKLNIKCYDNEIISELAKEMNIDINLLKEIDEKEKDSFWYGFATNNVFANSLIASADDSIFLAQSRIIENIYKKESCIIVGRCSDVVLNGHENVIKIFIYSSDKEFKIERKMKFENLTRDEASEKIKQTDKQRANYYNRFTGKVWGDRNSYDLSIDTSKVGVEESVALIEEYLKKRI